MLTSIKYSDINNQKKNLRVNWENHLDLANAVLTTLFAHTMIANPHLIKTIQSDISGKNETEKRLMAATIFPNHKYVEEF